MLTPASLVIRLHPNDDVVIARQQLVGGTVLVGENVKVAGLVPPGHKIATRALRAGDPVRRYNQIIGFASRDVAAGEHVHLNNLEMRAFDRDYAFGVDAKPTEYVSSPASFMGIARRDGPNAGKVATRNYLGILSTVNCSATVARAIAAAFDADVLRAFPNVDGVVALTHGSGCGMDMQGEGLKVLRRTLAGYARHPNFAGVLVVGLGCEANQIGSLLGAERLAEGPLLRSFNIQDTGGTRKTVERGIALIEEMLPHANDVQREPVPASNLVVGLQCGGSDGYSGITANPALGAAVDRLVRHGGTAILSETPEIYGAEHLLTRRAVSRAVGEKLVARIKWWEDYTSRNRGEMNNNPSPGNKAGGLTTILEKSLGAVAKGGTTNLVDVYEYAEAVTARGFVYMDTPGYDPVSATGQVAGGANMIVFTTGRGSAYGCAPSPSLKLSTNTPLWVRQEEDIDLNCGDIADGGATIDDTGERLFALMLETASGTKSKSERHGYGQSEFVPWQLGAVM
ncbi:MAG: altronate dehydratase [Betaproteobacteria bacterium]|jgi:altronate hydrolase|nr:altronate dehydratase [Betaproteobacteria bacterium]MBK6603618.1 altronate dehydratase [Betaproteobacteria bacterium]MBK7081651.1 altronate dehydratase [Betaproteobacteria bacterium]MBK7744414.1 altronate dehydratase [Betaproteobacteria bacterium]MBK8689154.1 altronate dehydratase [Betaproteobacteria bacterium]